MKLTGGVGGGIFAAIRVEHNVPKDVTVLGMAQHTNLVGQLTEPSVAGKYDVSK